MLFTEGEERQQRTTPNSENGPTSTKTLRSSIEALWRHDQLRSCDRKMRPHNIREVSSILDIRVCMFYISITRYLKYGVMVIMTASVITRGN